MKTIMKIVVVMWVCLGLSSCGLLGDGPASLNAENDTQKNLSKRGAQCSEAQRATTR